jgi:dihydrofolate reductase
MKVSMIVAASENNVIGKGNDLVWHMPSDFKYFKNKTKDHIIIMGRKTYESLGKPLPYRTNVVLSRNEDFDAEGTKHFKDLEAAISWAKDQNDDEIFIIGGANIYRQSMEKADRIYLTRIHGEFEGDAFFPEIGDDWKLANEEKHSKDEKNPYDYTFLVFDKIKD